MSWKYRCRVSERRSVDIHLPNSPSEFVLALLLCIVIRWIYLRLPATWFSAWSRGGRAETLSRSASSGPDVPMASGLSSATDYTTALPPPTRASLAEAAKRLPEGNKALLKGRPVDEVEVRKNMIPFDSDFRACGPSSYTPTAMSVQEIKSLGDFPDYAALSEVPLPDAYRTCNVDTALPRPYRPFRWAYHQTMSLTKMEENWWLELDKNYAATIAQRVELFHKHGRLVLNSLPGTELAVKEVMEMALQFYCARYPQYFSLHRRPDDGYVFTNGILKHETVIKRHHPLHVLLHNVPEDFAIMVRNPADGCYYLRGGILCSSLGWNLQTKLDMPLKEIHGPIPDYKEKMQFSMDRYFSKMACSKPIQRGSWGLEIDKPLFMPPGDPIESRRLEQDPVLELSRIHLRVDWQTLRRLPLSGAIVFNFKALFTPIEEFRDEAYVPALMRKVLMEGKESIMRYKNTWHVEHVVLPALKMWEKEQVEKGLVEKDWPVSTLDESPWFPGWEGKWHGQQGF